MNAIYLDHAASTPVRPEVAEAMAPFLSGSVGNPSSVHRWGRAARAALDDARERVGDLLGVGADEVRFVRGGTESTNLAILGRAAWLHAEGRARPLVLRSAIEHPAVLEPFDVWESRGARVGVIGVEATGAADVPTAAELTEHAVEFVSFQWVNQETGMILPVREMAEACAEAGVPLHVDAIQAPGRIEVDLGKVPASLVSFSGHKLGGPAGTGVLVVRRGTGLAPILFGGGQERGLRPGTEDVAGAVGFARAFEIAVVELAQEGERLASLTARLAAGLRERIPDLRVRCEGARRAPHILGVAVPGLLRDVLLGALDMEGIAASAGSACRAGSTKVSPVLEALFGEAAREAAPLRLSLGWSTTAEEVAEAIERIPSVVLAAREAGRFDVAAEPRAAR